MSEIQNATSSLNLAASMMNKVEEGSSPLNGPIFYIISAVAHVISALETPTPEPHDIAREELVEELVKAAEEFLKADADCNMIQSEEDFAINQGLYLVAREELWAVVRKARGVKS